MQFLLIFTFLVNIIDGQVFVDVPYYDCHSNLCFGFRGQKRDTCIKRRNCKLLVLVKPVEKEFALFTRRQLDLSIYLTDDESIVPTYVSLAVTEDKDDHYLEIVCKKDERDKVTIETVIQEADKETGLRTAVVSSSDDLTGIYLNPLQSKYSNADRVLMCNLKWNVTSSVKVSTSENEFNIDLNFAVIFYNLVVTDGFVGPESNQLIPVNSFTFSRKPLDFTYVNCTKNSHVCLYFPSNVTTGHIFSQQVQNLDENVVFLSLSKENENILRLHLLIGNTTNWTLQSEHSRTFFNIGLSTDKHLVKIFIARCFYMNKERTNSENEEQETMDSGQLKGNSYYQEDKQVSGTTFECTWTQDVFKRLEQRQINLLRKTYFLLLTVGHSYNEENLTAMKTWISEHSVLFPHFKDWSAINLCSLRSDTQCFGFDQRAVGDGKCLKAGNCKLLAAIRKSNLGFSLTLRGILGADHWIAISFSIDTLFRDGDLVLVCSPYHQEVTWNTDHEKTEIVSSFISKEGIEQVDNSLSCRFRLPFQFPIEVNNDNETIFSMNASFVLALSYGQYYENKSKGNPKDFVIFDVQFNGSIALPSEGKYQQSSNEMISTGNNFISFLLVSILTVGLLFGAFTILVVYQHKKGLLHNGQVFWFESEDHHHHHHHPHPHGHHRKSQVRKSIRKSKLSKSGPNLIHKSLNGKVSLVIGRLNNSSLKVKSSKSFRKVKSSKQ